jgi:hypothetical protein
VAARAPVLERRARPGVHAAAQLQVQRLPAGGEEGGRV